ncbi:hypothetical protein COV03_00155, partial [Candidatus Uhrbacteria bacterium CG10_big_fil_rev_8_21_14_0_10_41_26]
SNKIQAIVLAGGKGTRLAPLTDNCPKSIVPVNGKPMMVYVLEHLKKHGITNVAVAVSHLGQMIEDLLGDGSDFGMQISYVREPEPMGTGGWSQLINWNDLDDHFLVLNSDNLFWIDVEAFMNRNRELNATATIAAIEIDADKYLEYELCLHDKEKRRLINYVDRTECKPYLQVNSKVFVSSGWYVMTPKVKDLIPRQNPISNEADIWPLLDKSDKDLGFYHATEPWFDSGTHERLERVAEFIKNNPDL